ncbi:MAG: hypothetical protein ACI8UO_000018 [Verrucomicrobiales bacterium]|jgi:hypothetical protein
MPSTISAPKSWVQSVSRLCFPTKTDQRLQQLMDRNNEGQLTPGERTELEALVEMSEELSLVRAEALRLLDHEAA